MGTASCKDTAAEAGSVSPGEKEARAARRKKGHSSVWPSREKPPVGLLPTVS